MLGHLLISADQGHSFRCNANRFAVKVNLSSNSVRLVSLVILLKLRCILTCPKCDSEELSFVPAEIRLYRNRPRTLSHPPILPQPDVLICHDCGYSEFRVPEAWLRAGWLRPSPHAEKTPSVAAIMSSAAVALATAS